MKTKAQPAIHAESEIKKSDDIKRITSDLAKRKELKVSLKISGGIPSQAYRFNLNVTGEGSSDSSLHCAITNREGRGETNLEAKELNHLFTTITKSNILNIYQAPPLFLPDTLIGILEISYHDQVHRIYFAADEAQAEVQNMKTPSEVKLVIDQLYKIGNKILKLRSVKP